MEFGAIWTGVGLRYDFVSWSVVASLMGMFSTFPGMSGSSSDSCSRTHMQTLAAVRFVVRVCPEALRWALLYFLHFVTFCVLRRSILSVRTGAHRKSLCANKGGGEACTGVLAKRSVWVKHRKLQ